MDRNAGEGKVRVSGEPFQGRFGTGGEGLIVADLGADDVAGVLVHVRALGWVGLGVHGVLCVLVTRVA